MRYGRDANRWGNTGSVLLASASQEYLKPIKYNYAGKDGKVNMSGGVEGGIGAIGGSLGGEADVNKYDNYSNVKTAVSIGVVEIMSGKMEQTWMNDQGQSEFSNQTSIQPAGLQFKAAFILGIEVDVDFVIK